MSVPFNDLARAAERDYDALKTAADRVLRSGWYILGAEVDAFERAFASYIGVAHCVGVNSGTDALILALRALGVQEGDEVITVGNTAIPTVAAIRVAGATPVFVDIDDTHELNPEELEKRITKRTKAIIPVHLYGFPADMHAIMRIAQAHSVKVLEDAAQAHGATIDGVKIGTFGDIAAFSFYPTKNLGAFGDGGAIVTNDSALAERVKRLRTYGEESRYVSVEEGFNSRLDEMQAALLSVQLPNLDTRNTRRREIADRYLMGIQNPNITLPKQSLGGREGVWHLFVVQVEDRKDFMEYLKGKGIGCAIHYPVPVYRQKTYEFLKVNPTSYPTTESVVPKIVSLPIFPELTDAEIDEVVSVVNGYRPSRA